MLFLTAITRQQVTLVLACLACTSCGGRAPNSKRHATSPWTRPNSNEERSRSNAVDTSDVLGRLLLRLDNSVVDRLTRSNGPIIAKRRHIQSSPVAFDSVQNDLVDRLAKVNSPIRAKSRRARTSPMAIATIREGVNIEDQSTCADTEAARDELMRQLRKQLENEKSTQETVTLKRQALGSEHPTTVQAQRAHVSNLNQSVDLKKDVLLLLQKHCGKDHPESLEALKRYAAALSELGREGEAKQWKQTLVEISNEMFGSEDEETLVAESSYAATLRKLGEYSEEEQIRKKVFEVSRATLGDKHPETLKAELQYANVLNDLGKEKLALPLMDEVHEFSRQVFGTNNLRIVTISSSYADTLDRVGRETEAEPLRKEALEISRTVLGKEHLDTIRALEQYAQLLCRLDREAGAESLMKEVYDVRHSILGADHPDTIKALKSYAVILRGLGRVAQVEALRSELSRHAIELNDLVPMERASYNEAEVGRSTNEIIPDSAEVIIDAFERCETITKAASKSFATASALLNNEQKRAIWSIYTWCRRTDDLVDSPIAMMSAETMRRDLSSWRTRLYRLWRGEASDSLDLALLDTFRRYPTLSIEPFFDMIEGMLMDTPQFGQDRYETWDELYLYCYRVASTVGLMTLPIFGTAPGYTEEEAKEPAIALGIGLQITNILRDVGEDARRGRIYLPREDMKRFGVTEDQIMNGVVDEDYINLMKFEIQRARDWYKKSHDGIPMLHKDSRLGVRAAGDIYGGILDKLEENGYDNFKNRAYVPKLEKFTRLIKSWQTVSKMP